MPQAGHRFKFQLDQGHMGNQHCQIMHELMHHMLPSVSIPSEQKGANSSVENFTPTTVKCSTHHQTNFTPIKRSVSYIDTRIDYPLTLTDSPLSIVNYISRQHRRFLRLTFRPASLEKDAVNIVLKQLPENSRPPLLSVFPFNIEPTTFLALLTVMTQAISEQLEVDLHGRTCRSGNGGRTRCNITTTSPVPLMDDEDNIIS